MIVKRMCKILSIGIRGVELGTLPAERLETESNLHVKSQIHPRFGQ